MTPRPQTYYGVSLGILMVKSSFRRFPGDIGNALTWPFPVQYRIVEEALPSNITNLQNVSLLEPFKRAADELVAGGVAGITTTCGFLSLYQRALHQQPGANPVGRTTAAARQAGRHPDL